MMEELSTEKLCFVWMSSGKSIWENNEIRYSIRSVLKYHPDAEIIILGEKPIWYTGKFIQHTDVSELPYINKWKKTIRACESKLISNEFVSMDDDFFLMAPLERKHYANNNTIKHKEKTSINHTKMWTDVIKQTSSMCATTDPNFYVHTPLWIEKKSFMNVVNKYKGIWDKKPSLGLRQIYCVEVMKSNMFELEKLLIDVKIVWLSQLSRCDKFFSTHDNLKLYGFAEKLNELFPEKSIYEK